MEFNWKEYQDNFQGKTKEVVAVLDKNFQKICVTRVSINLFTEIKLNAYGVECRLSEVANVILPSARVVNIKPYDTNLIDTIDKAIRKYKSDLNPVVMDDYLRISFPSPTEESRKKAVKEAKEHMENAKISIKHIRKEILQKLKNEKLPEDQEKKFQKILDQEMIKNANKTLENMFSKKEKELMTI